MNLRLLGAAAAVVAFAVALWWLLASEAPAPAAKPVAASPAAHASPAAAAPRPASPAVPAAHGGEEPPAPTAAPQPLVRGRVVDDDGQPVSGGNLSAMCLGNDGSVHPIPGSTGVLSEEGTFQILGCAGTVCVELHHAEMTRAEPWTLHPGAPKTLRATGLARVSGVVLGPDDAPVPGANVVAVSGPGQDPHALPPFTTQRVVTDAEGAFSFAKIERSVCDPCLEAMGRCNEDEMLPTWTQARLAAWREGLPTGETRVDLDADDPVVIRIPATRAPISGRVDGDVPAGAYVLARSEQRPYEQRRGDLDGGRFELVGIGDGPYGLRLLADGRELATARGVEAGQDVTLRVSPAATP